jgi:hypothetical protein
MQRKPTHTIAYNVVSTPHRPGLPVISTSVRAYSKDEAYRKAEALHPSAFGSTERSRAELRAVSIEEAPPFVSVKELQDFIYEHKGLGGFIAYSGNRRACTVQHGSFRGYEARADGGSTFRYHLDGRIERRES